MGQWCCWLTSGGLPGPHLISGHFTHFAYPIGAPPAAVPVLVVVPRVGECECVPAVSSAAPTPSGFIGRSYMALFFPSAEPLGLHDLAWGLACSQGVPDFYPPHMNVGLPNPLAPPPLHP